MQTLDTNSLSPFCPVQVMKLGGLEIHDGWMDGDVEVLPTSVRFECLHTLCHSAKVPRRVLEESVCK